MHKNIRKRWWQTQSRRTLRNH